MKNDDFATLMFLTALSSFLGGLLGFGLGALFFDSWLRSVGTMLVAGVLTPVVVTS